MRRRTLNLAGKWGRVSLFAFERAVFSLLLVLSATPLASAEKLALQKPVDGGMPAKVLRYAAWIVRQYDADQSGQLEKSEWIGMKGEPHKMDANQDGILTVEEFARHVSDYGRGRRIRLRTPQTMPHVELPPLLQPATVANSAVKDEAEAAETAATAADARFFVPHSSRSPRLPKWFVGRDTNGDGQLTLAEFAPKQTRARIEEFRRLDQNGDGILTEEECLRVAVEGVDSTTTSGGD